MKARFLVVRIAFGAMLLSMAALLSGGAWAQDTAQAPPRLDVPYVPTPEAVVDKMLELAKVKKGDML
ncbi:MAG: hypothetical protein ACO1N5_00645, partial [Noviherbaspirillum sp.]